MEFNIKDLFDKEKRNIVIKQYPHKLVKYKLLGNIDEHYIDKKLKM